MLHRVTVSVTYELPIVRVKFIVGESNCLTNSLFSGIQISTTGVYQRGAPLNIISATGFPGAGLTAVGNLQRRPNRVAGVEASFDREEFLRRARAGEAVFNREAFALPGDFEFGNAARTYNDIRRDNYKNVDFSIIKNVAFNENRQKLQLRAEFLNVFNFVVFGTPNTQFGSTAFGTITTQGNRPRIIQLVGRFTF